MATETKKIQVLPFAAVNEFMRDDYRLTILQEVFSNLDQTPASIKQSISRLVSKGVQIPGFRNSSLAPVHLKIKNSGTFFERSSEFAALIIEAWSNFHEGLKKVVWEILTDKNWQPDALELDRTTLPGFKIDWPKKDTFEVLIKTVRERQPAINESDDHISLMVVWIGNRLPYNIFEESETSTT
jgi:hypothetical protein